MEAEEFDGGEADGVGPVRRAAGEDPDLAPAAQLGGSHRGAPPLGEGLVEDEDEPEMTEARQAGKGLGPRKLREQLQPCLHRRYQARLTGDAKLAGVTGADQTDGS